MTLPSRYVSAVLFILIGISISFIYFDFGTAAETAARALGSFLIFIICAVF